ncbi:hypothetical protein JCM19237_5043 [Photobacterium aphoticum]|uniref:Uncharacterized protein n=1 Tax=Photobacterium aphoticum TaxID=754436 RepID=A0A090QG86_9GAMM|nr:hypothetical protein JCM19237_5043 [Photobacterium aphoticum]
MQKDEKKTKNFSIFIEIFITDVYSRAILLQIPKKTVNKM